MNALDQVIARYGGDPAAMLRLDGPDSPALLPYATLAAPRESEATDLVALAGVYEWQDSPLVFLVEGDRLTDKEDLRRIRRRLALRGDAPYLGVARAGRLTIYTLALDDAPLEESEVALEVAEPVTLPYLAAERPSAAFPREKWIADLIHRLLLEALSALRQANLSEDDAVSLVGRTLFTRFLADRDLIPASLSHGRIETLFDTPERAVATSDWLDRTFNGDFLPLTADLPDCLPPDACHTLGNIMRRAPGGQLYLGWKDGWAYLDFAQIPVGVLSQAYEGYLREHDPARRRTQGAFYTPRPIAEILVRGAFHALRREGTAHTARVLDPAAGAGIFLITAFRQLVAERWTQTGTRPDTATLRNILYGQLTGFDIDEVALRFAALGLYLMAIELDAQPEPVGKLRFEKNLRDRVLWKVGDPHAANSRGRLGSLGNNVAAEHCGRYDLVVGNPPWTGAGRIPNWREVTDQCTRIARERLGSATAPPPIPNEVPDLPLLWRALEWARPDGQIALALHGRLLFQQGDGMPEARAALFSAVDVTAVINGSELRNTNVWPQVTAPFCLVFAHNRVPPPGSGFRFLSPRIEPALNGAGTMRIDPANAELVTARGIGERPTLLKTLFRGTRLDLELLERIEAQGLPSLDRYWRQLFGEVRNRARQAGNGYQRLRNASRTRMRDSDGLPGVSAAYLHGLPEFHAQGMVGLLVDPDRLLPFDRARIHDPRARSLFAAPLVIARESPPARRGRITAWVSPANTVFNQSYYGYSSAGHPEAESLARHVALLLGSRFALWHALVRSGKFGVERDTIEMATIGAIPIVPIERLTPAQKERIGPLFDALAESETAARWAEADAWIASLYGLGDRDIQVIEDTLAYSLPFAANRSAAQQSPRSRAIADFCCALREELAPWGNDPDTEVSVTRMAAVPARSPWEILEVRTGRHDQRQDSPLTVAGWAEVMRLADGLGAAEIMHADDSRRTLWVARLRPARYWTKSQAWLLARRILWEHGDELFAEALA